MRSAATLLAGLVIASGPVSAADKPHIPPPFIEEDVALIEDSARQIHDAVITIDTHVDIPPNYATSEADPGLRGPMQVDLPKMREGGLDAAFFIVFVPQGDLTPEGYAEAYEAAIAKFDAIDRLVTQNPGEVELALTPDAAIGIAQAGKRVAMIGVENGFAIGEDLKNIEVFYQRGARYMSLTHGGHNQLADSSTPRGQLGEEAAEVAHAGLSDLGGAAVAEMNRLGIMIDVSHASNEAAVEAAHLSRAPVIASHSAVQGVLDVPRNLNDDALKAIAAGGGVAQIVAFDTYLKAPDPERLAAVRQIAVDMGLTSRDAFRAASQETIGQFRNRARALDAQWPRANVADLVDHIDYAVDLIGIDHVGISSDFGGGGGIIGWDDASETLNVTRELVRRGYTFNEIEKLWGGNFLRVWRAVEAAAD
ncbi:MAG: dipeptidase [Alphaproteobacteria bacterium]